MFIVLIKPIVDLLIIPIVLCECIVLALTSLGLQWVPEEPAAICSTEGGVPHDGGAADSSPHAMLRP